MAKIPANHVILFFTIFIFSNLPTPKAEIQTIKLSSDSRPFILLEDFGFTATGHISVAISSLSVTTTTITTTNPINSSQIGFFFAPPLAFESLQNTFFNNSCILGKPFIFPILKFNEIYLPFQTSFNRTFPIPVPDFYYIFFLNCAPETSVSMAVHLEAYNINPDGQKDYLDEHFTNLPTFTFLLSFIYFLFLLFWLRECIKNRSFLHKIHMLMTILLLTNFLNLLCSAENQHSVQVTGDPNGWDILWLFFHFSHGLVFVSVVVLIGSGWSLLRPFLQIYQKLVLGMVAFLQLISSSAFIMMRGGGPFYGNYRYWVVAFYAFDFICSITMVFPVVDSIETLKETSKTEGKEARNLAKLRLFSNFHITLQGYVYITRMGIFILRFLVNYKFWWVTIAMEQMIDLLFYMVMYHSFSPSERTEYIVLEDKDEELAPVSMQGSAIDL